MDDIDLEIISQLKAADRTTFKALGKITGYTSRASRREAIRISAELNLSVSDHAETS